MLHFDVNLLDRIALAARRYPERAADIMQCFKKNQLLSKHTLTKHLPQEGAASICVLGGWYGIGFMLSQNNKQLQYTIVDLDPVCQKVGELIGFRGFTHITHDATSFDVSGFDIIVNCSSEHMNKNQLQNSFDIIPIGKKCIFQNNNNFHSRDHVNCFESVNLFVDYLSTSFAIEETIITPMDNTTERFTVICKKM